MKTNLDDTLNYDPLAHAEKITGRRWSDDPEDTTSFLGLLLALQHGEAKQKALSANDGTHFHTTFADFKRIAAEEGFAALLEEPTANGDALIIFWHPEAILLAAESYGASVNTAQMYYNVQGDVETLCRVISSGHFKRNVLVGDHDVREGFRHKLAKLRSAGTFLPVWIERPFLWLLSYSDTKQEGYDYRAINAARIAKLPVEVQQAISPKS